MPQAQSKRNSREGSGGAAVEEEELLWVRPFTFKSFAMFTSPWYMKLSTAVRSVKATPLM